MPPFREGEELKVEPDLRRYCSRCDVVCSAECREEVVESNLFVRFMTVSCALHLCLSPRNRLSSPMARSNRFAASARRILVVVLGSGAGIFTSVDPYCEGAQLVRGAAGSGTGFRRTARLGFAGRR